MLINNPDALKSWLVVVLEPLCDADSSALARYVLALVKKDKPEKELKRMMIDQLDVFLGEETKSFVERLFNAINSEEYLNLPTISPSNANVPAIAASIAEAVGIASEASGASATSLNIDNVIRTDDVNQLAANAAITQPQSASMITQITSPLSLDLKTKETQNNASRTYETNATERLTEPQFATNVEVSNSGIASGHQQQQQQQHHHHHHQAQQQQQQQPYHNQQPLVRSASPPARMTSTIITTNADKENQPRDSRRRRASLRSRSRSRSRSNDRTLRRSRSRDRRANEREKNQRQFRNKSPAVAAEPRSHHLGGGGGGRRNFDRRRLGGVVGGSSSGLNDERSPRFGVGVGGSSGSANGNSKGRLNRSNSPRSRSPTPDTRQQRLGERHHPQSLPHHQLPLLHPHDGPVSINNEQRQRCRDFDEKGYCVRGETCPWDHGVNPVVFEGINNSALISMSLREYNPDAPDLWSRAGPTAGAQQPPAGVAPPSGAPGSINPFSGNVRPNATLLGAVPSGVLSGGPNNGANDYARNAAIAGGGGGGPMMQFPFNPTAVTTPLQRQLVPIPVVDANSVGGGNAGGAVGVGGGEVGKRRFDLEDTVAIADASGPPKRKLPINSRLGPRVDRANMQHNCALELRKVPRGLNTIAHLNNHFAKFGKIINIQVSYDGDPEAAIITFSAHAEANVAYRSTEAVLNNRFIKVFWHSNQENASGESINAMGGNAGGGGGIGIGGRKNTSQYHLHNVPAVPTPTADSAKIANTSQTPLGDNNTIMTASTPGNGETTPTATTALPSSMRLKRVSSGASSNPTAPGTAASIRKKQEEQAKAVVQLANGLRKRKQELLQSYVKQMKSALELVERCEPQDPQRAKTLSTIKVLQETIDKLHKEIATEQEHLQAQIANNQQQQQQQQNPTATPAVTKKSKEQQKKELLDIELELFAQQQEGNDTSAIQKRLEELQRNLGIAASGGMPGAGGNNAKSPHYIPGVRSGKQRATYPEGSTRVDRRPKTIVVTGFAAEDADFVLGHFKHFGEITKHDVDREIPQLILSYATRITAEQAVLRGKLFKDKRLQISWAPVVVQQQQQQQQQPTNNLAVGVQSSADKGIQVTDAAVVPITANSPIALFENPKQLATSMSESESILANDTLPELRLEDEEEDDESEDRSWRR